MLLFLNKNKRMKRKDFQKEGMDYRAAISALNRFHLFGITDFEEVGDYNETQIWFLTEKGIKVAQSLSVLIDLIREDTH